MSHGRILLLVAAALVAAACRGGAPVRSVTPLEAAQLIRQEQGRVRVVLLYSATCPSSRKMFPEFLDLAERHSRQNVAILAFSTDKSVGTVQRYLGSQPLPFERRWIRPWRRGELDANLTPTGVDIGETWGTPLVAVMDREGRVVGQWEGSSGARKAKGWLHSIGVYAEGEEREEAPQHLNLAYDYHRQKKLPEGDCRVQQGD